MPSRLASLRHAHLNRLKNRAVPLPRTKRPEHLKNLITLAPTQVVEIDRSTLNLFADQKVDQTEKSLKSLLVEPPRKHSLWGAAALYVLN